jgi:hypothetical protein
MTMTQPPPTERVNYRVPDARPYPPPPPVAYRPQYRPPVADPERPPRVITGTTVAVTLLGAALLGSVTGLGLGALRIMGQPDAPAPAPGGTSVVVVASPSDTPKAPPRRANPVRTTVRSVEVTPSASESASPDKPSGRPSDPGAQGNGQASGQPDGQASGSPDAPDPGKHKGEVLCPDGTVLPPGTPLNQCPSASPSDPSPPGGDSPTGSPSGPSPAPSATA